MCLLSIRYCISICFLLCDIEKQTLHSDPKDWGFCVSGIMSRFDSHFAERTVFSLYCYSAPVRAHDDQGKSRSFWLLVRVTRKKRERERDIIDVFRCLSHSGLNGAQRCDPFASVPRVKPNTVLLSRQERKPQKALGLERATSVAYPHKSVARSDFELESLISLPASPPPPHPHIFRWRTVVWCGLVSARNASRTQYKCTV